MINAKKKVTLKDIAEHLGVSKTIVSKVVNNRPGTRVREETRKKILSAVRKYNYYPLSSAQSLATKKTGQIAFLLSSRTTMGLANNYYSMILAGVNEICNQHGYQCVINVYDLSDIENFVMPENLIKRSIDGCLLLGPYNSEAFKKLVSVNMPIVAIGGETDNMQIPVISRNIVADLNNYMAYFKQSGHKNIWMATDSEWSRKNIRKVLEDWPGLNIKVPKRTTHEEYFNEFCYGEDLAKKWLLLPKDERPTLVFGSDQWCVGFLSILQKSGIRCPEEVSVVTEADSVLTQWHFPKITAFTHDNYEIGKVSAQLLLDILENKTSFKAAIKQASEMEIESKLVERDSVKNLIVH
jgi:LacI family transcriptional regulator